MSETSPHSLLRCDAGGAHSAVPVLPPSIHFVLLFLSTTGAERTHHPLPNSGEETGGSKGREALGCAEQSPAGRVLHNVSCYCGN